MTNWRTAVSALSLVGLSIASANMPPTVAITGYGMGAYELSPCAAETSDPDGSVVKVAWYANDQKLGESFSPPYCYHWSNVAVGFYTMVAVATDEQGATGTSAPLTIEIKHPFQARILTPTNGQVFLLDEKIRLTASTTNGEGAVSLRYDYDGYNAAFEALTNPPYEAATTAYSLGKHYISGLAVQDGWNPNRYATIPPVWIYVIPVRGFPFITDQPTNQIVQPNTHVVLRVSAFAELPMTYQWRFNGVNLANETNEHLALPSVQPGQAGAYSVVVSTATGALPSDTAFVDVLQPTAGTVLFANQLVDAPLSLTGPNFEARIYAGPRPDALACIPPALTVPNNPYFNGGARRVPTVAPGRTAYVRIVVRNLDDPNGGYEASNLLAIQTGNSNTPAPLVGLKFSTYSSIPPLNPDPEFFWRSPRLETGVFGSELTIQIGVRSYAPRLSYQLQKDGQDIPGAAGTCVRPTNSYSMTCGATLVLTNLQLADAASYRLRVDNGKIQMVSPQVFVGLIEPAEGRFVGATIRNRRWCAQLRGRLGQRYFIQCSSNLLDWATISTVTNVAGTVALEAAPTTFSGHTFYRAMSLP